MKMKKEIWRKRLAVLLAASMVLSMNTAAFAEEITAEAYEVFIPEEAEETSGGTEEIAVYEEDAAHEDSQYTPAASMSFNDLLMAAVDPSLFENALSISENLNEYNMCKLSGSSHTFAIVYPKSLPWRGTSIGSKNTDSSGYIMVWYGDPNYDAKIEYFVSKNGTGQTINSKVTSGNFIMLDSSKLTIKIKAPKGATVKLDGSPLYPANKSAYISGIKINGKENKELNKELKKAMKEQVKKIKAMKTEKVSANGYKEGGTNSESDYVGLMIGVYPAYIGNGVIDSYQTVFGKTVTTVYDSDLASKIGLYTSEIKIYESKTGDEIPAKIEATILKYNKNGSKNKKVTLKPTKPGSTKYKGYGSEKKTYTKKLRYGYRAYTYIEADGNYSGYIILG